MIHLLMKYWTTYHRAFSECYRRNRSHLGDRHNLELSSQTIVTYIRESSRNVVFFTDVISIRVRLLVFDSFVIMRQFMRIVVQNIHKKQLHDVHWLCRDICIPTGSIVTTLGGALRRMCLDRMKVQYATR